MLARPAEANHIIAGTRLRSSKAADVAADEVRSATNPGVAKMAIAATFPEVSAAPDGWTNGLVQATFAVDTDIAIMTKHAGAGIDPLGSTIAIDAGSAGPAGDAVVKPSVVANAERVIA